MLLSADDNGVHPTSKPAVNRLRKAPSSAFTTIHSTLNTNHPHKPPIQMPTYFNIFRKTKICSNRQVNYGNEENMHEVENNMILSTIAQTHSMQSTIANIKLSKSRWARQRTTQYNSANTGVDRYKLILIVNTNNSDTVAKTKMEADQYGGQASRKDL